MTSINRGLLVVKPKQPFLNWLNSLPDEIEVNEPNQEDLDESFQIDDYTAYLVPEFEDDETRQVLEEFYSSIFEEELVSWSQEESDWPKNRDLTMFLEWFEVEFHSMVVDLAEGLPITDSPYEQPTDYDDLDEF
jgi:hypothetical protein